MPEPSVLDLGGSLAARLAGHPSRRPRLRRVARRRPAGLARGRRPRRGASRPGAAGHPRADRGRPRRPGRPVGRPRHLDLRPRRRARRRPGERAPGLRAARARGDGVSQRRRRRPPGHRLLATAARGRGAPAGRVEPTAGRAGWRPAGRDRTPDGRLPALDHAGARQAALAAHRAVPVRLGLVTAAAHDRHHRAGAPRAPGLGPAVGRRRAGRRGRRRPRHRNRHHPGLPRQRLGLAGGRDRAGRARRAAATRPGGRGAGGVARRRGDERAAAAAVVAAGDGRAAAAPARRRGLGRRHRAHRAAGAAHRPALRGRGPVPGARSRHAVPHRRERGAVLRQGRQLGADLAHAQPGAGRPAGRPARSRRRGELHLPARLGRRRLRDRGVLRPLRRARHPRLAGPRLRVQPLPDAGGLVPRARRDGGSPPGPPAGEAPSLAVWAGNNENAWIGPVRDPAWSAGTAGRRHRRR